MAPKTCITVIRRKRSMRGAFDPQRQVAKTDVRRILEAACWVPTSHNMQNFEIIVIDDQAIIEELGNISSRVTETSLRENFQQLSMSEEEFSRKRTGILGTSFPSSRSDPTYFRQIAREGPPLPLRSTAPPFCSSWSTIQGGGLPIPKGTYLASSVWEA
jgi:nitroreductase